MFKSKPYTLNWQCQSFIAALVYYTLDTYAKSSAAHTAELILRQCLVYKYMYTCYNTVVCPPCRVYVPG